MAIIKAPERATVYGLGLRRLREDRGWSQRELSVLAKVPQPQISAIELGVIASPGADTLARIAGGFGLDLGAFMVELEQAANRPEKAA